MWLGSATRPIVADHGREREQQRHAGGDDGAEDEQQDDQGERDRPLAGLRELLVEHLVERLAGADRAGLADVEVRVRASRPCRWRR